MGRLGSGAQGEGAVATGGGEVESDCPDLVAGAGDGGGAPLRMVSHWSRRAGDGAPGGAGPMQGEGLGGWGACGRSTKSPTARTWPMVRTPQAVRLFARVSGLATTARGAGPVQDQSLVGQETAAGGVDGFPTAQTFPIHRGDRLEHLPGSVEPTPGCWVEAGHDGPVQPVEMLGEGIGVGDGAGHRGEAADRPHVRG